MEDFFYFNRAPIVATCISHLYPLQYSQFYSLEVTNMIDFNALKTETREIITDLLNDGSDPDALYIIEHHIAHHDF
ncbi:RNase E inhibitor protein, partial [Pasteurella multocida subsp. multocida str. Anand1_cattle]